MKSVIRVRMGAEDAHYGGNLVDGAHMLHLFGDVATELLIMNDGDEGLFKAYDEVEFLAPVYAGDYIETHLDSLAASLLPPAMHTDPAALEQMRTVLAQAAAPEMVSLRRYDPAADLARIACPLLAIVGEKDTQVPPSVVEGPLREGIAPDTELTIKVYPGLNHLFQHAATGLPSEYGAIEETLAPDVLADMAAWVLRVAERR